MQTANTYVSVITHNVTICEYVCIFRYHGICLVSGSHVNQILCTSMYRLNEAINTYVLFQKHQDWSSMYFVYIKYILTWQEYLQSNWVGILYIWIYLNRYMYNTFKQNADPMQNTDQLNWVSIVTVQVIVHLPSPGLFWQMITFGPVLLPDCWSRFYIQS